MTAPGFSLSGRPGGRMLTPTIGRTASCPTSTGTLSWPAPCIECGSRVSFECKRGAINGAPSDFDVKGGSDHGGPLRSSQRGRHRQRPGNRRLRGRHVHRGGTLDGAVFRRRGGEGRSDLRRSEERRVGNGGRSGGGRDPLRSK